MVGDQRRQVPRIVNQDVLARGILWAVPSFFREAQASPQVCIKNGLYRLRKLLTTHIAGVKTVVS